MQYRVAGYTLIACNSIAYAAPSVYASFAREIIMSIGSRRATTMDAGERVEGRSAPGGVTDARMAISSTMDSRRALAVRRLIEAQGGRIWAHPREGGGSVFLHCASVDLDAGLDVEDGRAAAAPARPEPPSSRAD